MDENNPALSLSKYLIERDKVLSAHLNLDFKDDKGALVLSTKSKLLVTEQSIQTPDGNVLCTVTHKMLSMMPTYEMHEGGPKGPVMAVVKEKFELSSFVGLNTIDIEDQSGTVIATSVGQLAQSEFSIKAADGTDVAIITKQLEAGGLSTLLDMAKRPYQITILDKKVPTIVMLGFLVVVELMAAKAASESAHRGGMAFGAGVGVGGFGGGFGGGGRK